MNLHRQLWQLRGEWVNEVGFRKSYFKELRSRKLHYLKYEQKGFFFFNFDSINISHSVFDPIRYIDVPCCHKFFIQLPNTVLKKGEDVDPS